MLKKTIPLSLLYFIGAVLTVNTLLGKIFYFEVIHRVIYIPLIFWFLTALYTYIFGKVIGKSRINIAFMLTLGLPLHLVLLLLNSYFSVALVHPRLGYLYKVYIEFGLYAFMFLILFWGIRVIRESILIKKGDAANGLSNIFFLPILYVFFYAVYLTFVWKSTRSLYAFILIALISFYINSSEKAYALFLDIFTKIKRAFLTRGKILLVIFVIAFSMRLLYGFNTIRQTQDAFPTASDDGVTYDMYGKAISKDISFVRSSAFLPNSFDSGYSVFLGFLYKIFGSSFYIAVLLQSLMGACVPILVYRISEIVFGRKQIAALAAIWCSLDQTLIMLSSVLGTEALYIPLLTCLILIITKYSQERERARASILKDISMGALFGLAAVTRTAILHFLPLFVVYLFFLKNKKPISKKLADIILIIFAAAVIISPLTYQNYLNSGKFHLLTLPKMILNWEADLGAGPLFPSNVALAEIGINPFKDLKGSVVNIIKNPGAFLSVGGDLLLRKSKNFFFCYNFGFSDPVYMLNPAKIANSFASNLEFYLALLVWVGFILIMLNKELRKKAWPILLIFFYYIFLHVVVARMGNSRYRGPANPYFIIFGSLGIFLLLDYTRKGLNINR